MDRETQTCPLDGLQELLCDRTRIVAVPHVSNLLGQIEPLEEICRLSHEAGARVVADGVAFAPHRVMDVKRWGVDWYLYSAYKLYGPHVGVIWGVEDAFEEISGPNHFFVPANDHVYKFELGGVSYEACAGMLALQDYLSFLSDESAPSGVIPRRTVERAFANMDELERPLTRPLLDYLATREDVRVIGPATCDDRRVPTISFTHSTRSSRSIALAANSSAIGLRHGHFYAHRLASALCEDPQDGVVRVSMLHYNTSREVEQVTDFLDRTL